MNFGVTRYAQPTDIERAIVIGVMRLYFNMGTAVRADIRPKQRASAERVLNPSPRGDFYCANSSGIAGIRAHAIWIGAFPSADALPITFAIVIPPFIAAFFCALRMRRLPSLGRGDGAGFTSRRSALWMPSTEMEILQRLCLFAGAAVLHGITILTGNHYSLEHEGRK